MRGRSTALVMLSTLAVLWAVVVSGAVVGCAGDRARSDVLGPAIVAVGSGIEADALRGVAFASDPDAAAVPVARFFGAIRSGDRGEVRAAWADWAHVKLYAEVGVNRRVDSGEIGPGVAESLLERLAQYENALLAYTVGSPG